MVVDSYSRDLVPAYLLFGVLILISDLALANYLAVDEAKAKSPVGVSTKLEQIVLPGSELQVKPMDDRKIPIILRIVATWQHGDSMRYDFEFIGLEPGDFDLKDYLFRADGSDADDLPAIPIHVTSILPEGQVQPNPLDTNWPAIKRYKPLAMLAAIAWLGGLIALILWRRNSVKAVAAQAKPRTFAEMLEPRLKAAMEGELNTSQLAELERFVVEFWRRRLRMSEVPVNQVILKLRNHDEAGPLLKQLEKWIHAPAGGQRSELGGQRSEGSELARLLEPYRTIRLDDLGEEGV